MTSQVLLLVAGESPLVVFDAGHGEFAFQYSAGQVYFDLVVGLTGDFVCADVGNLDPALAFIYRAFVSEEFKRVVEDFCSLCRIVHNFVGICMEAPSLQTIT